MLKTSGVRFLLLPLYLCLLSSIALGQQAVHLSGRTPVGEDAPSQKISMTLPHGGTVDRIKVFSQGVEDFDFRGVSDTCKSVSYAAGQSCTVDLAFSPKAPGERHGVVLLLDGNQQPLAVQHFAATATGPVATFVPGLLTTAAGNGKILYSGDNVLATNATLFIPFGVTLDGAGTIYIADTYNNRIRKVAPPTPPATVGVISTIAGNGTAGFTGDTGLGTSASLNNPSSVQLDALGNLYIADTLNNRIRVLNLTTGIIATVAGTGTADYTGDGGLALAATLNAPNGLSFDTNGNLYIADTGNNVIRLLNTATNVISTVAGTGAAGFSGDGAAATAAKLNQPWSVTVDTSGALYIADKKNNVVRKVDTSGNISTIAGTIYIAGAPFAGDGAIASAARLNAPSATVVDIAGNIYIADTGNNRIRKINPATSIITTIAGGGIYGDQYPANVASLSGPYAIALDTQGSLFIADAANNRIRKDASNNAVLNYPIMRVGAVSAPMSQIIENDGVATLNVTTPFTNLLYANVDPATTCGTAPVAPLAQCTITAEFAPTIVAPVVNGNITVPSDASNAPNTILLKAQVQSTYPATVQLSSFPNPSIVGNGVQFSVQVFNSGGVVATGTVTLLDDTTTIATITLANGIGSATISNLTVGTHQITASYGGDANDSSAVSSAVAQVVTAVPANASTTTSLTSSANPSTLGQILNLNASVAATTAGQDVPTGSVTFAEGTTVLGTANLTAGLASIGISTLTAGTHLITATYGGSGTYAASTSPVLTQLIGAGGNGNSIQFTLAVTPATLSLGSGAHTTLRIAVAPSANFSDTLSFGCGGLPAYATCTFSQNQVAIATGAKQTLSVVIDTGNPLGSGPTAQLLEPGNSGDSAFLAILPGGALLAFFIGRKRRRNLGLLTVVLALGALTNLCGCGSSYNVKSTPAGGYTFQVFATGTNSGASFAVPVQLTVTK